MTRSLEQLDTSHLRVDPAMTFAELLAELDFKRRFRRAPYWLRKRRAWICGLNDAGPVSKASFGTCSPLRPQTV